jgi:hypothetical protein
LGPKTNQTFDEFLEYAQDQQLSMRWSMHVWLDEFLSMHPEWGPKLDSSIPRELLLEACNRWTGGNQSPAQGLLLTTKRFEGYGFFTLKIASLTGTPTVSFVKLKAAACPRTADPVYIQTLTRDIYDFSAWTTVPR